ncbi:MAG: hypothetical protein DCC50_02600 [Acidobacteria bacterium]|nr:MAG: hypothetical protein DCC50_02600 [Acidobacteriota bacterium]
MAAVSAVGVLAQTGLLGGSGTLPTAPAAVPDGYTTFVFASPDVVGEPVPGSGTERPSVPAAAALDGTSWVLEEDLWGTSTPAAQVVGGDPATTTLEFGGVSGRGWGFDADGCGAGWFQDDLTLSAEGRFPGGDLATDDQGCPEDAQAAEDFWIRALSGGGYLRELGSDWLLVSVVVPAAPSTDAPAPTSTEPAPTGTTGPTTSAPTGTDGRAPVAGPAFVDPQQESVDQPWPAAGGDLLAPTVRAGRHDGFDRVVVDLTGTDDPGWRAAYTDDPRLDGSGAPAGVAGDSVLGVVLTGMAYPEPGSGVYADGTLVLDTGELDAVVQVRRTTPFEGTLEVFVGIDGEPRPYRVFLLQEPMRLVIDVRTG